VDVSRLLDELTALVDSARSMPMSASCIVNREEMLEAIEKVRESIPADLREAREVLAHRSVVVQDGRDEAQRLVDDALNERSQMLSRTEIMREAGREAEELLAAARADAERMRREVDDYIDAKLANFEIVLHKTLGAVERGRAKISGRHEELSSLAADPEQLAEPLPG